MAAGRVSNPGPADQPHAAGSTQSRERQRMGGRMKTEIRQMTYADGYVVSYKDENGVGHAHFLPSKESAELFASAINSKPVIVVRSENFRVD
jgi:hypothetical protein